MYTATKHVIFSQMLILPPYQKQRHGSKSHNARATVILCFVTQPNY